MTSAVVLRALAEPREKVVTRALRYVLAVRDLETMRQPVAEVNEAEISLAFACRDLVDAVNALPPEKRPRGWGEL